MSDPKRLRDNLDSPFERDLLLAADIDRAPEGAENKAIEALGLGLASVVVAARTSTAPALASTKAASSAVVALKWFGVVFFASSLAVLGVRTLTSHKDNAVATAPTLPLIPPTPPVLTAKIEIAQTPPQAVVDQTPPQNEIELAADPPAPNAKDVALTTSPKVAPSGSAPSTLNAELQMIDRARKANAAHDANGAAAALDDYERVFPHGALREEAGVARIEALLEARMPSRALSEGDLFNARYPDSAYQKTVASLKKRALLMAMEKSTAH